MAEETLKQKTAKGLFWGGVSNGVQQLLGVLFGIYLARILNAEDYGLVGMLAIFTGIAGSIINSGFTVALINKQDATHKDYNAVFWFTFFVGFACYIILFFCAPLISDFYQRPELTNLSRVLFLTFFVSGCAAVSYTVMFKQLMVKQQALIDITAMLLSGLVGVTLAMKGHAYWALALQSVTFICGGALLRFIISPWKPTLEIDFKPLKGMLSFSIKMFFTNVFQQVNNNIFSILLGRFYNAVQVGYYTQGNKWMVMGSQSIWGMFSSVSQPVLVEASSDRKRQLNVFRKMIRLGAFISFPVMLGLAFIAEEFIQITIGTKWQPSVLILQILCILGAFTFLQLLYTQVLIAYGRSDIYFKCNLLQGVLQLLSVIIAFNWGIYVMTCVYVFAFLFSLSFWHFYVKKEIGLSVKMVLKDISVYLFLMTFIILFVYTVLMGLNNLYLKLFFKIFLSGILYLGTTYMLGSQILKEFITFVFSKRI